MVEQLPDANSSGPSRPWWLIAVGLVAALLHGAICLVVNHDSLSNDEQEYVALAKSLADDGRFVLPTGDAATRMPMYPFLLSLVYRTQEAKYWLSAVDLLHAMMAILTTIGLACIAARLADARAGAIAGLAAALYGPIVYLQTQLLTETLALLLMTLAIWVYVAHCLKAPRQIEQRIAPWFVSVLLGLATLTRANAALLIVPFVIHAFLRTPHGASRGGRLAAMILPAALIIGGWMARNEQVVGKFSLSTIGGLNFYLGHNADYRNDPGVSTANYDRFNELRREGLSEVEADRRLFAEGLAFARANPGEVVMNMVRKCRVWFTPTTQSLGPSLLLLVFGAMIASMFWPSAIGRRWALLRWLLLVIWAVSAVWYAVWAYRMSTIPIVSAKYLLPLGIPAILFFRPALRVRGLFIGLVLSQLFVALAFIPISRLRWVMDALLIVALAVAVSNVCEWMRRDGQRRARQHGNAESVE